VSLPSRRNDEVAATSIAASQPIANYQVDSSQRSHQLQTNGDWCSWLLKDAADAGTGPYEDIALNDNITIKRKGRSGLRWEHAQILNDEDVTVGSTDEKPVQIQTPRIYIEERPLSRLRREYAQEITRPMSRMNDRFPMIETGRPSSRTQRKPTPPTEQSMTRSPLTQIAKGKMKADEVW